MLKNSQLLALSGLESFNYPSIFTSSISFDDSPHEFDLLHAVIKPVDLSYQVISFHQQGRVQDLTHFCYSHSVGLHDRDDSMELGVMGAKDSGPIANWFFAGFAE